MWVIRKLHAHFWVIFTEALFSEAWLELKHYLFSVVIWYLKRLVCVSQATISNPSIYYFPVILLMCFKGLKTHFLHQPFLFNMQCDAAFCSNLKKNFRSLIWHQDTFKQDMNEMREGWPSKTKTLLSPPLPLGFVLPSKLRWCMFYCKHITLILLHLPFLIFLSFLISFLSVWHGKACCPSSFLQPLSSCFPASHKAASCY